MFRWNNHKDHSRKFDRGGACVQRHLYEHFQLPGHTGLLQDTYVTLIDKTDPRGPTKREDYWIHTLKTKGVRNSLIIVIIIIIIIIIIVVDSYLYYL